jgi:RND family efflux transporter MFP subunit
LRVTAEVDEDDLAQIREGQRALLRADAFAGQVLNATVAQITPKGDATRKAYRVRLTLPDDTPLMICMTVEANIVLRETNAAVLIPPAALRGDHVFMVQGEVARRRQVTVGVQGPRAVEIRQGIAAGDLVVLDPPQGLKDGQALRLRP